MSTLYPNMQIPFVLGFVWDVCAKMQGCMLCPLGTDWSSAGPGSCGWSQSSLREVPVPHTLSVSEMLRDLRTWQLSFIKCVLRNGLCSHVHVVSAFASYWGAGSIDLLYPVLVGQWERYVFRRGALVDSLSLVLQLQHKLFSLLVDSSLFHLDFQIQKFPQVLQQDPQ